MKVPASPLRRGLFFALFSFFFKIMHLFHLKIVSLKNSSDSLSIVNLRINQTLNTGAVRNARRMNQNQRYEVRMDFKSTVFMPYGHEPGYECRMAFPEASTPQNRTYRAGVKC